MAAGAQTWLRAQLCHTWRSAIRSPRARRGASGPAELAEAVVVDPEVVTDLVQHGHPHLRGELLLVACALAQRAAEDRDPIGHHTRVRHRVARRERDAFVE